MQTPVDMVVLNTSRWIVNQMSNSHGIFGVKYSHLMQVPLKVFDTNKAPLHHRSHYKRIMIMALWVSTIHYWPLCTHTSMGGAQSFLVTPRPLCQQILRNHTEYEIFIISRGETFHRSRSRRHNHVLLRCLFGVIMDV